MTTNTILSVFFLIEFGIIVSALSFYLFLQLKKLKAKLAEQIACGEEAAPTLHDLFERQIARTRKKISEKFANISQEEHDREQYLLTRRIDFLKLEKEVLDDNVTDQSYWNKITTRLAELITVSSPQDNEQPDTEQADNARYLERIANYQAQLNALQQEFDDYRKYSHKLSSALSDYNKETDEDTALMELMADFKAHDERLQQRLSQLQRENAELENSLDSADKAAFAHNYQTGNHSLKTADSDSPVTSSEEEINRLRDIIDRQYSSIDELKQAILTGQEADSPAHHIEDKLDAVFRSQQELQTCVEVLEMENQRLTEEISALKAAAAPESSTQNGESAEVFDLRLKTKELQVQKEELNKQLEDKNAKLESLQSDYESLQDEFMNLYSKGQ
jgi:chromosome segregation ATPase